jgi:hypothetical protein
MVMASLYVAFDQNRDSSALSIIYVIFGLAVTIYCLAWDFYMDWGLFRTRARGKYLLRDKLLYPIWFYYFGMVVNTFLRLFWLFQVVKWEGWAADP